MQCVRPPISPQRHRGHRDSHCGQLAICSSLDCNHSKSSRNAKISLPSPERSRSGPEGTIDNSPAIYRRVRVLPYFLSGRPAADGGGGLPGKWVLSGPGTEVPGYYRASLRDETVQTYFGCGFAALRLSWPGLDWLGDLCRVRPWLGHLSLDRYPVSPRCAAR